MPGSVAIIGAGRMGRGIARALEQARVQVALLTRDRSAGSMGGAALVLLATPDDAIVPLARDLARSGEIGAGQVVLHLSGLLDHRALAALSPGGAAVGSFHPLQSIADPAAAPARLAGAYAALEGDEPAVAAGERLAALLKMRTVRLAPGAKPAYHAAAVFVSNYVVALAAVAQRLARDAGVSSEDAAALFLPLMRGTVANLELGAGAALTGPIRRADVATIRAHLAALGAGDRALYRALGRATLSLAREAGLQEAEAASVERELDADRAQAD